MKDKQNKAFDVCLWISIWTKYHIDFVEIGQNHPVVLPSEALQPACILKFAISLIPPPSEKDPFTQFIVLRNKIGWNSSGSREEDYDGSCARCIYAVIRIVTFQVLAFTQLVSYPTENRQEVADVEW